jgi:hypothetical protein
MESIGMDDFQPDDLLAKFWEEFEVLGGRTFFSKPGLARVREFWCAGHFARVYELNFKPCQVRIDQVDDQGDVDFDLGVGPSWYPFQVAEVLAPDRRRSDEYKKGFPEGGWLESWSEGTVLGSEWIRQAGDMSTPKELMARYQYMFPAQNLGFGFARGWFPGFVRLCESIDGLLGPNKRGFHWTQLKEKMGTGRYHYSVKSKNSMADSGLMNSIRKVVESAESATLDTCIYCGRPGSMNNNKGYMMVRSERHRQLAESGSVTSPWFDGDDL